MKKFHFKTPRPRFNPTDRKITDVISEIMYILGAEMEIATTVAEWNRCFSSEETLSALLELKANLTSDIIGNMVILGHCDRNVLRKWADHVSNNLLDFDSQE